MEDRTDFGDWVQGLVRQDCWWAHLHTNKWPLLFCLFLLISHICSSLIYDEAPISLSLAHPLQSVISFAHSHNPFKTSQKKFHTQQSPPRISYSRFVLSCQTHDNPVSFSWGIKFWLALPVWLVSSVAHQPVTGELWPLSRSPLSTTHYSLCICVFDSLIFLFLVCLLCWIAVKQVLLQTTWPCNPGSLAGIPFPQGSCSTNPELVRLTLYHKSGSICLQPPFLLETHPWPSTCTESFC